MALQTIEHDILALVEGFNGKIAYKIENGSGDTIGLHKEESFQSASLIKIPMIIEGYRQSERKKINLKQSVTIPPSVVAGGSGVLHTLSNKVSLTVEDLLTLMITVSDNTATNMMMSLLGIDEVNQCIKELGLKNTKLERRMQDFKALKEGRDNTISAEDTIICLKAIHTGDFLAKESQERIMGVFDNQQLKDKLPSLMGGGVKIASKTGGIRGVSHDCAIIRSEYQTVYAAVLTENTRSEEDSRQVISKIGKLIYDGMMSK
ncbi:serine hydrolase [Peribacillus muralis]|uniref:serine hydrolase n=1 Tax=Peribacillus muralis TaxID=264697 RepID=UPI001F4DA9E4|nr:serine hydrolase [Peribacillus muralis]MCK1992765.1 class A beta-lactamase-related serine hydrolase [Peribacillus muralis]MCK2013320.1 class A beta-lactamase-related serine hydrolase [Peribacillus muralis]